MANPWIPFDLVSMDSMDILSNWCLSPNNRIEQLSLNVSLDLKLGTLIM